jgi:hypothetical protein
VIVEKTIPKGAFFSEIPEAGGRGVLQHINVKKSKATRTEGNTEDNSHLLLKRAGAIYRKMHTMAEVWARMHDHTVLITYQAPLLRVAL